jgi:hypothetical protein
MLEWSLVGLIVGGSAFISWFGNRSGKKWEE